MFSPEFGAHCAPICSRMQAEEALACAKGTRPLGRTAEPSEIADAVVYLASKRASYITGAVLAMDGAVTPMVV